MATIEEALQIGWRQHQAGDLRGAENIYRQVLLVAPSNENAWCFLGMACHDQGRFNEAVDAYEQALQIRRKFPVALSNRGNTLKQLGRLEEAEASCREALQYKPDYSTAYNNLGVVLVAQGRLAEASATFEKALQLMPQDAVAHANLGAALVRQGKFDEGTVNAQKALRINPNYAEAHKNQAIVSLLLGDFDRGWPEYEWRWKCPGSSLPRLSQPRWNGESVEGKTILLHWEQGLGDTIQFVRYARLFKRQGARVIVCTQKPLMRLLEYCEGIDQLVAQGEPLPEFDCWVPLLSIPGVLKTNLETIPSECGYLRADPKLVDYWQGKLSRYNGYKVAIAWQGSPDFHADRQRSVPLKHFGELAKIDGVQLIAIQKGPGTQQIQELNGQFDVIHFGDELDASGPFLDTAAIMSCVDLVVTSDTSVPHLAGGLGVPVWMGLSVSPDWRWLLEREDTPWYPSMKLYRQGQLGDWDEVFRRIAADLKERIAIHVPQEKTKEPQEEPPVESAASPPSPAISSIPPAGFNSLARTAHGVMLYNKHDMYIGRSLDEYGEFGEEEVELLLQLVQPGDTVVEAGANIGTHTVPLAKHIGKQGVLFAFEPQRLVFQTLCANLALNSLRNVFCRQQALGAEPGQIVVPLLDPESSTNFGGLGLGDYRRGEVVPVTTIDELQLPSCRLIKIDVEGMEEKVLQGAAETLARCRPFLYVENDREDRSPALIQHLQARGYMLYWHTPFLFRESNYSGNKENVFGNIVSINMLCVPEGSSVVVPGLRQILGPYDHWNRG